MTETSNCSTQKVQTESIQSDQYVHVLYEFIYLFIYLFAVDGERGVGGICMCVFGEGGGLLTAMAVELLTSKITTVCETKRGLCNILVMAKLFDEQLLPNFDQTLSRTSTTKIRSNVLIN